MAMSVTYTTFNGQIVYENRNGVGTAYSLSGAMSEATEIPFSAQPFASTLKWESSDCSPAHSRFRGSVAAEVRATLAASEFGPIFDEPEPVAEYTVPWNRPPRREEMN